MVGAGTDDSVPRGSIAEGDARKDKVGAGGRVAASRFSGLVGGAALFSAARESGSVVGFPVIANASRILCHLNLRLHLGSLRSQCQEPRNQSPFGATAAP